MRERSAVQFCKNFHSQSHMCGSALSFRRSAWLLSRSERHSTPGARGDAQV